jgi:hypothetical protein
MVQQGWGRNKRGVGVRSRMRRRRGRGGVEVEARGGWDGVEARAGRAEKWLGSAGVGGLGQFQCSRGNNTKEMQDGEEDEEVEEEVVVMIVVVSLRFNAGLLNKS